jgi:hypothetical protein
VISKLAAIEFTSAASLGRRAAVEWLFEKEQAHRCVTSCARILSFHDIGVSFDEKQIPQIIENTEKPK